MGQSLCRVWALCLAGHSFSWPPSRGTLGLPGPAGKDDLIWIQGLPQLSRKPQKETQGWVGEMISQQLKFQAPHSSIRAAPTPTLPAAPFLGPD